VVVGLDPATLKGTKYMWLRAPEKMDGLTRRRSPKCERRQLGLRAWAMNNTISRILGKLEFHLRPAKYSHQLRARKRSQTLVQLRLRSPHKKIDRIRGATVPDPGSISLRRGFFSCQ